MRTIEVTVYRFDELSEKAKVRAITEFGGDDCEYLFQEAGDSIDQFAGIFGIDICRIDLLNPSRSEYRFTFDTRVEDLRGWRLATYIWNNYREGIFKGKYYGKLVHTFKDGSAIPRLKDHPNGTRHVKRYSKIFLSNACVLTGICYDDDLLTPVYEFLKNPDDSVSIIDLLESGINSLCKSVQDEYEYRNSMEGMADFFECNDYEFTKDGSILKS